MSTKYVIAGVDTFELELIHRDEINVAYIMRLLSQLKNVPQKDKAAKEKELIDLVAGETELRSKRELIEKFIQKNLPEIGNDEDVETIFKQYWQVETVKALDNLCIDENLDKEKIETIISDYLFTERKPNEEEVINALVKQPSILHRDTIGIRITDKIIDFVKTFIDGI